MAGRPTLWGASEILRAFFSKAAEPPPSFWLALIIDVPPNPYTSGEEINEPLVESGYARVEVPNNTEYFGDLDSGQLHLVMNLQDITFSTATSDWGLITHWALCDAEVDGGVYFFGDLMETTPVFSGDQVIIDANLLAIEFGPFFFDEEPL